MTDLTSDELDLPTLLTLAGGVVSSQIVERMRQEGFADVRTSHGYVLQLVVADSPTIGSMAESLGVTQQAVSKSVGELQRLGYVDRVADPVDARARRVELTARGRELIEAGRAARQDAEASIAREVSPEDLMAARRVLAAILRDNAAQIARRRMPLPG
ncbi:MarR family winged helix-turn-helix transcriptional regulator [Microbacterium sp.]|uniref:MarR family winged helix-turn-helix transcriptional regulator n=1 Tax=Microbacterium sp. TaxID=51671 RepID=UPI003F70887E